MLVIALVGQVCAGKRTAATHIALDLGVPHVSITDLIRQEHRTLTSAPPERAAATTFANQRRQSEGGSYFVKVAMAQYSRSPNLQGAVLSGITCVSEARYILGEFDATIVSVSADPDVRWERLLHRRADDYDLMTQSAFHRQWSLENAGTHDYDTNISAVSQLASVHVLNDGALSQFKNEIANCLPQLKARLVQQPRQGGSYPPLLAGLVDRHSRADDTDSAHVATLSEDYQSNHRLERTRFALDFIKRSYSLEHLNERDRVLAPLVSSVHSAPEIGNQFGVKLTNAFLVEDPGTALVKFREIPGTTLDEEQAVLLNDTEFLKRHEDLHRYLSDRSEEIHDCVVANLGTARENDRQQFTANDRRPFDVMSDDGTTLRISASGIPVIRDAQRTASDGVFPVLENVKNQRILEVAAFRGSKVSLAIHDTMDHVWLFDLLARKGLFDKFREMFTSIGNPEAFDIFRREGEIVASIGFGVRHWANVQVGFVPLYSLADIHSAMETHFDAGRLLDTHMDAFRHLRSLSKAPYSRESQSLAFVFSNYLVELDEQRRKHGRIKVRNPRTHKVTGELDPWGPDYLAFFVEAHQLLVDSHNKHRDTLLKVHIIVEEFLSSPLALDGEGLRLSTSRIGDYDFAATSLPPGRIDWMARNYGFSAIRESLL